MSEPSTEELYAERMMALRTIDAHQERFNRMAKLSDRLKYNAANIAAAPWAGAIAINQKFHPSGEYLVGATAVSTLYFSIIGGVFALAWSEKYKECARSEVLQATDIYDEYGLDREEWVNHLPEHNS